MSFIRRLGVLGLAGAAAAFAACVERDQAPPADAAPPAESAESAAPMVQAPPDLGLSEQPASIGVKTAAALLERFRDDPRVVLLDVRTPAEVRQGHVKGAEWLDFRAPDFREKAARLDRERAYIVFCRSGNRSGQATAYLRGLDFPAVWNVTGGVIDWKKEGLPLVEGDATPAPLGPEGRASE
jgi:rhodanese-related sulfurtransferase